MSPEDRRRKLRSLPTPEAAGGAEYYAQEKERALAFDPRRRSNYNAYKATSRTLAQVEYLPIKLDIENVSRCNFRCSMCAVSDWPKGKRAEDMSFDQFQQLIDEQYGLIEIKLQGIGEPLMQGDDFFKMIRYARSKHLWVRTTTNASLLHLKDNYKKLIDADPNEVQISIDGANKEVFESIRQGSVFERVVENCRLINAYCRKVNVQRTKMWTIVQRKNQHQLRQFVELAAEMGFTNMVFSLDVHGWGDNELLDRNRGEMVEDALDPDQLFSLVDFGRAIGVDVSFWNVSEKFDTAAPQALCPWPFERSFVASDSRIVPCCMIGNPDAFEIESGHGMDRTFGDVWSGTEYQDFRKAHLDGAIPAVCRNCYK